MESCAAANPLHPRCGASSRCESHQRQGHLHAPSSSELVSSTRQARSSARLLSLPHKGSQRSALLTFCRGAWTPLHVSCPPTHPAKVPLRSMRLVKEWGWTQPNEGCAAAGGSAPVSLLSRSATSSATNLFPGPACPSISRRLHAWISCHGQETARQALFL